MCNGVDDKNVKLINATEFPATYTLNFPKHEQTQLSDLFSEKTDLNSFDTCVKK